MYAYAFSYYRHYHWCIELSLHCHGQRLTIDPQGPVKSRHVCGCDRAALVSDAIVNYFLVDLDIERHFVALHRYLLLQDGEYTQSLTDQLFDKVFLAVFDI